MPTNNPDGGTIPCFTRATFHAARSANVEPSHKNVTHRKRPPLVVPHRSRKCGRVTSTTTSSNCRFAISETRRPQQHARRTITRLRWTFAERAARGARSARTAASSRRGRRRVWSRFQVESPGMVASGFEEGKAARWRRGPNEGRRRARRQGKWTRLESYVVTLTRGAQELQRFLHAASLSSLGNILCRM
jgi:hypothetical protein